MLKMRKASFVKLLFLPLLFTSFVFLGMARVSAAPPADVSVCQPYEASWKVSIWKTIDMQSTMENLTTSIANVGLAKTFGKTANDIVGCESEVLILNSISTEGGTGGLGNTDICPALTDSVTVCPELMNVTKTMAYNGRSADLLAINSSLLGISNRIQNTVFIDPIAVSLAFYWKNQVAKVPFVGRTYAATLLNASEMAIMSAILKVWEAARDISLAFMAVILMYTGIMIVMRKKVNQQLVVSVQYAIPKIIIGLILILFSYPIGAAITGLSWGLFRSATDIVVNTLYGTSTTATEFANKVLLALVIGALKMGFFGGFALLLIVVVAVATLVILIIVNLKALIIYLKMVLSTVTAPFEFALGTVPGSEDRIKDWFLRMAKYGLTIFAMGLIIPVTLSVAFEVLMYYSYSCTSGQACNVEVAGMGSFMTVAAPLVIVILGLSLAMKMEDSVDKMIFGGKGKKK
jgi:hypothetical protein